jgi:uncharacterized protein (TIGR00255 family)
MIFSMTGYAVATREVEGANLSMELRAVNHRYLDAQFRLPDELRAIEPALRETLAAKVGRGKVECRVNLTPATSGHDSLKLNPQLLEQVTHLAHVVRQHLPGAADPGVADILRWPGMIIQREANPEELRAAALELFSVAVDEFNASRAREGAKLRDLLRERLNAMETIARDIAPLYPKMQEIWKEKLTAAVREAGVNPDEDRILQELAIFAQRIDVDEELSRLTTHITEARRILDKGGSTGKRLDFLMQEFNREANTLGSKSVSAESTQAAMELKVLIEQMREQVQNME